MNNKIGLFWGEPHYPSKLDYLNERNPIFKLIEEGLYQMGLDREHFRTPEWNPFLDIIKPGDTVLIKPNMVLDENRGDGGTECLYTHPSLVVPIIKYTAKALQGIGEIVVGDAPLQECNFEKLIKESGYEEIIEYFRKQGITISLVDFRNVITYKKEMVNFLKEEKQNGVLVSVDGRSAFAGFDDAFTDRFRVTNYAPSKMRVHHNKNSHKYMVSEYLLNADVVINMPKPKTHRKSGVTAALKNMVGINANKEYLPHHRIGGTKSGGDEYKGENRWLDLSSQIQDIANELMNMSEYSLAEKTMSLYEEIFARAYKESETGYSEGSWYGNDTIWRTIQDLNTILIYADKKGIMTYLPQRKIFIVADMIIAGEKEGPLEPSPKPVGLIAMGENPILFDKAISKIMGFDWNKVPLLKNIRIKGIDDDIKKTMIVSNCTEERTFEFEPPCGWIDALGSAQNNKVIELAKQKRGVYLFGACPVGRRNADMLLKNGVNIISFLDNDQKKHNNWEYKGIHVISPYVIKNDEMVIITTLEKYVLEIREQLYASGIKEVFVMR